jgi:hypothetical protein
MAVFSIFSMIFCMFVRNLYKMGWILIYRCSGMLGFGCNIALLDLGPFLASILYGRTRRRETRGIATCWDLVMLSLNIVISFLCLKHVLRLWCLSFSLIHHKVLLCVELQCKIYDHKLDLFFIFIFKKSRNCISFSYYCYYYK